MAIHSLVETRVGCDLWKDYTLKALYNDPFAIISKH